MKGPRVVRHPMSFGGLVGAMLFFCLSLTPSLLPRSWLLQGVVGGVTAAIGYGVGDLIHTLGRRPFADRLGRDLFSTSPQRVRDLAWQGLLIGGPVACFGFLGVSSGWQRDLRRLMGMHAIIDWHVPLIVAVAAAVLGLLLLLSRVIRLGTRRVIAFLDGFIPRWPARVVGFLIGVAVVVGFAQGVLFNAFLEIANQTASLANRGTSAGVVRPVTPDVSGGPSSLVSWESLGREGREFVATATRSRAAEPIRVYVGLESAKGFEAQARLAVRELERTGAFTRPVLAVITTTGTGWVDPRVPAALEHMYNGNSATVAIQYSYLPSWISFIVDRSKAAEAGRALIGAVHAKWVTLPPMTRPRLVVSGESLGSYGTEKAFRDPREIVVRTDGALLLGPPNVNPIWGALTARRDPASPIWRPVVDGGRTVRFAQMGADLWLPPEIWGTPRVVYLQNASDPVVWWTPDLLLSRPDWLNDPKGPDVAPEMRWFPFITFWQVTVDLVFANSVPEGHGHRYGSAVVDGWAAIVPPDGWTAVDTVRLRPIIEAIAD